MFHIRCFNCPCLSDTQCSGVQKLNAATTTLTNRLYCKSVACIELRSAGDQQLELSLLTGRAPTQSISLFVGHRRFEVVLRLKIIRPCFVGVHVGIMLLRFVGGGE